MASFAVFVGSARSAPPVETAYVSPTDAQPGGPTYPYRIGIYEITNEQYVQFLNDAILNLDNERGAYLYYDSDSGNLYIHTVVTGAVGTAGAGTLLFDNENNLDVTFDEANSQYEITLGRDNHPVTGVSWYGAIKYCNWLTIDFGLEADDRAYHEGPSPDLAGWRPVTSLDDTTWAERDLNDLEREALLAFRGFRLPMDEGSDTASPYNEWYKAAAWNGLTDNLYGFGPDPQPIDGSFANYINSGDPFDNATTPVRFFGVDALRLWADPFFGWGDLPPPSFRVRDTRNGYGLYDVSGNVWEWMQDQGGSVDARRNRGGSWRSVPQSLVTSLGTSRAADAANDSTGFRIVQSVPRPLLVTPLPGLSASGVWGGPYDDPNALTTTYKLHNLSNAELTVHPQADASWVRFLDDQGEPTTADLVIPDSSTVESTVEIAPLCTDVLTVGLNTATVEFVDLTDGSRATRAVQLVVTEPLSVLPVVAFQTSIVFGGTVSPTSYEIASLSDSTINGSVTWEETTVGTPARIEWLSLNGTSGPEGIPFSIDSPATFDLEVAFDPTGLEAGTQTATVHITDECTGQEFLRTIELVIDPPFTVSPAGPLAFSGTQGGPFLPVEHVFEIAEAQDIPQPWKITVEPVVVGETTDWLSVTPLTGDLIAVDSTAEVTITIDALAAPPVPGTYEAQLVFEALDTGYKESRLVTLEVSELAVSPADGAVFAGLLGGPFSPISKTYTINNSEGGEFAWSASFVETTDPLSGQDWLDISPASGVILDPTGSADVEISLAPAAAQLPEGEYTGTITFTSLSSGATAERQVTLIVGSDGFSLAMVTIPPEQIQPSGPEYRYRIGKFEVTNADFVLFLNDARTNSGNQRGAFLNHDTAANVVRLDDGTVLFDGAVGGAISFIDVEDSYVVLEENEPLPVVGVSWFGAVKYCNWLTLAQGMDAEQRAYAEGPNAVDWVAVGDAAAVAARFGFRLPMDEGLTTASALNEWYKAAAWQDALVANSTYGFGRDELTNVDANYLDSGDPFEPGPSPVGWYNVINILEDSTPTIDTGNAYGLYDMTGNVAEWMHDGGLTADERGVRGGHFNNVVGSALLRTDQRGSWPAVSALDFVGFRVVQTVETSVLAIGQPALEASRVTGFVGGLYDFHGGGGGPGAEPQYFKLQITHPGLQTLDDVSISVAPPWLAIEGLTPRQIPPATTVEVRLKVAAGALDAGISPSPPGDFALVPFDDVLPGGPDYSYWMGRAEVTNSEFAAFLNDARTNVQAAEPDTKSEYMFFDDITGQVFVHSQLEGEIGEDGLALGLDTMMYDPSVGRVQLVFDELLQDFVYVVSCDPLIDCPSFCNGGMHDGLACIAADECPEGTCDLNGNWFDNHPVVGVSWYGAIKYCNWRTVKEGIPPSLRAYQEATSANLGGWHPVVVDDATWVATGLSDTARILLVQDTLGYRLPMDGGVAGVARFSEWYKAASRAGYDINGDPAFAALYGYGRDDVPTSVDANFLQSGELLIDGTTPVRFFDGGSSLVGEPPLNCSVPVDDPTETRDTDNGYRLYDMAGNVAEWSQGSFTNMATRGGSWRETSDSVLLTNGERKPLSPASTLDDTGLRVVRGTGHVVTVTVTNGLTGVSLQRYFMLDLRRPFRVDPQADFVASAEPYTQPLTGDPTFFILTNESAAAMDWSVSTNVGWLDLVESIGGELTGTLDASTPITIDVSTNDGIDQLGPETHVGTITFRNIKTGLEHHRRYSIEIEQPITITPPLPDPGAYSLVWGESPDSIPTRRFDIKNVSGIELQLTVAVDQPWLTVEPVDLTGSLTGPILPDETISYDVMGGETMMTLDVGNLTAKLQATFTDTLHGNLTGDVEHELVGEILSPLVIDFAAEDAWLLAGLDPDALPSRIFTLSNISSAPIEVALSTDQSWLDVDIANLEILPGAGETRQVTVSINSEALDLPNDVYLADLMIDIPLIGETNCRTVELTVDEPMTVTPPSGFNTAGVAGTRIVPINKVYTLTNHERLGAVPIDWEVTLAAPGAGWLSLNGGASASGTLAVGATTGVVVAIDLAATASLAAGTHTAGVVFTDLTHGNSRTRDVSLTLVVSSFVVNEASVPPIPGPAEGPGYAFRVATFQTTNAEFAAFLNDARANGSNERGFFMYHDLDSGDVYINDKQVGEEGDVAPTGARTTLLYDSSVGRIALDNNVYVTELGYEQHPVVGVTWYGAVKYANWLTIDQGLPLQSRCYTEADGTNIDGWHPASISDADWLTRDLDAIERQDYVENYLGYRLPMDQGGNNVDPAADAPDAYNEWLKFSSFDPAAPPSIRSSPSGQPIAPLHWTFGFGRDLIDVPDANSRCSADPFESILDCLVGGTTPAGFYDGTAYNPGGNGVIGNGQSFATAVNDNFYGVFDAATNVREWLQGRFDTHPQSILRRTIRGGSWRSPATSVSVEAVFRNLMPPGFASDEIGFRVVRSVLLGDMDADSDVDAADFATMIGCMNGPGAALLPSGCEVADLDGNQRVDLIDVAIFQLLFTGAG